MTTARRRVSFFIGWLLFVLLSASTASAGTVYNFESCNLGPIGVWNNGPPPGCDLWYTPPSYLVPNSAPATVYPYSFIESYGVAADPRGGNNLLILSGNGNSQIGTVTYDRAQHGFNFSGASEWAVGYDISVVNVNNPGNSDDAYYIGGFSIMSTNGGASLIVDDAWDNSSTDSTWSSIYWDYDAQGNLDGVVAWTGLAQNHWYSESTVFDTNSNRILSLSLTDLTTNLTETISPTGWYMAGGAGAPFGANAFRFAGLGWGNGMLVDNVTLDPVPEPATLFLAGLGFAALIAFRRRETTS